MISNIMAIAEEMNLTEADLKALHRASLLWMIWKRFRSPYKVLNKPGKLTDEKYQLIKNHPAEGARILEPIQVFKDIRPVVEQHHERWDGRSYPKGLKGEEIHPLARILSVVDVYALYSDRHIARAGASSRWSTTWCKNQATPSTRRGSQCCCASSRTRSIQLLTGRLTEHPAAISRRQRLRPAGSGCAW